MNAAAETDEQLSLSVIVPIYNEESMLLDMAERMAPDLDKIVGRDRWQFVLVDNGSVDGTPQICAEIVRRWPASLIVSLSRPDYGKALYAGLTNAAGPWAWIVNVDFWDMPFLRWSYNTRGAYDLVIGSKRADLSLNRQHVYRRLLSWGLNTILQSVFAFVGSDTHGQKFLNLPDMLPIICQCRLRRGQFDTEFTLRALRARMWLAEIPVPMVEVRCPRNFLLNKIGRNLIDIVRLYNVLRPVTADGALRYHRWSRDEVEDSDSVKLASLVDLVHVHRVGRTDAQSAANAPR